MSLATALAAPPADMPPVEYRKHAEFDEKGGKASTGPVRQMVTDYAELLRLAGLDPEAFRIVGKVSQWTKTHHDKEDTYSFLFSFEPIKAEEDAIDLPALYAAARGRKRRVLKPTDTDRVTVVVLSDVQAGKTGSRGGTPELIERMAEKRARLEAHLRSRRPGRLVLAEAGDLFEGFESGGNPMFTNDLSLVEQMDVAATELFEFVELMQRFGPVEVMAVPSNHTAWRNGKQNLGRPADDLGLHVHRQVAKLAQAKRLNAHWNFPDAYNESMALDVGGTTLGLVHGNQFGPGRAVEWWAKQQHGGQPAGKADVLITGHYHHLTVIPTGRNPYSGRAKWWLQAPTLDNGSDWFRNVQGDDSSPGLLVFDVDDRGFDLQSLTVL